MVASWSWRPYSPFARFAHRAAAALRATSERFSAVSFFNRALPPRLPSATAAGFFRFAINTMLSASEKKCNAVLTC